MALLVNPAVKHNLDLGCNLKLRCFCKMSYTRQRIFRFTYTHFFAIILTVMFLVTVFLSFKLLTSEHCNCSREPIIRYVAQANHYSRNFESSHKLAVLVPFRNRFEELMEFAPYLHNFLNEQRINHDIFILNQVDAYRFNRASLINVGYLETKSNYDYIAMHDVDLLPLNKNLSYTYPKLPFHIAAPNLHPRYHYEKFIGGILLINSLVNGLSNKYWGWGLEDDEFYVRLKDANLTINRPGNISTGINDTFRHIHGKDRKRDTAKCYNQREVTRRRDRQTGVKDVKYRVMSYKTMTIGSAPLTVINVQLICDKSLTPWCDCSDKTEKKS